MKAAVKKTVEKIIKPKAVEPEKPRPISPHILNQKILREFWLAFKSVNGMTNQILSRQLRISKDSIRKALLGVEPSAEDIAKIAAWTESKRN